LGTYNLFLLEKSSSLLGLAYNTLWDTSQNVNDRHIMGGRGEGREGRGGGREGGRRKKKRKSKKIIRGLHLRQYGSGKSHAERSRTEKERNRKNGNKGDM
jgi:hypothetical protein